MGINRRTVIADYMRRHDPARVANVIRTHLGHATAAAGVDYRALCEGEAAARAWARDRAGLQQSGGRVPRNSRRPK